VAERTETTSGTRLFECDIIELHASSMSNTTLRHVIVVNNQRNGCPSDVRVSAGTDDFTSSGIAHLYYTMHS